MERDLVGPGQGEDLNVQSPSWKAEFLALKEQEPPDSWDMEFSDPPESSKTELQKPWKETSGFIPKTTVTVESAAAVEAKPVTFYCPFALEMWFVVEMASGCLIK